MRVLVINAGSSTIKLSVIGPGDYTEAAGSLERFDGPDAEHTLTSIAEAAQVDAAGHRVVHGGTVFRDTERIDASVERAILTLSRLAPLHQPRAVEGMRAVRKLWPELPQFACFDTAFHHSMAAAATTYALPKAWREEHGIQRFGFHGLSHEYATALVAERIGRADDSTLRVVCCHLGAGASLCATVGGLSVDTTMGWTPLEGLVMATRSGNLDPGAVLALVRALGPDAVETGLDRASGLAGLSGIAGGDLRAVLAARSRGDAAAELAFDVYIHRLRREIGAMVAILGGLDVLVFTGGVGEHSPEVRSAACHTLRFAGVSLDAGQNDVVDGTGEISAADASVRTFVVTAREDLEIARKVRRALAASSCPQ